jgi:hypothetical protein
MDTRESDRELIERILADYAKIPYYMAISAYRPYSIASKIIIC